MRIRRTRHLLAVTALTALALTACQNGTGVQDEGASQPASDSSTATAQQTGPGAASGSAAGSATGADTKPAGTSSDLADGTSGSTGKGIGKGTATSTGKSTGKGTGTGGTASRVLCNGSNTKVTAQPLARPLNHMLITVTNTGSKLCDLTYWPVLRFDEMQWAPQAAEETQPQAVTSLAPGESGYAGVLLSAADGSGDGGTTAKKLAVAFQGYTPNSDGGASAMPSLPAKGVYYDSSLTVTYWQQDRDDALSW
ncbi:DUF4232 domain-containing protein [Streptomyces asoensis]|uniref:DUF4232 domain-containing protein n=2 Tax=Streptomyces TaxID=1883 RepID=A0ABQ3S3B0_9ACTN|nr:DUF4232 domain-containing protein [Streptomyces asoensis]GGR00890.1 hypothetical protein GCM10010496_77420 [Streptomyces asoensis]GHI62601.1 hypothetical protein Saso_42510 [Streptomyces asoensis]